MTGDLPWWLRLYLPLVDGDGHPLCVACGEHVCIGCPAGHRYRPTIMRGIGPTLRWVRAHRACVW